MQLNGRLRGCQAHLAGRGSGSFERQSCALNLRPSSIESVGNRAQALRRRGRAGRSCSWENRWLRRAWLLGLRLSLLLPWLELELLTEVAAQRNEQPALPEPPL